MLLNCKKCGGNSYHKSGMMNKKQRYRCKSCGCFFTEGDARVKYNDDEHFLAITLFRKGLSLRSIAEIVGTNNVTILNWVRNVGAYVKERVISQPIEISESLDVIEIDEMWHYVKKNSEKYGFGLLTLVPKNASLQSKSVLVVTSRLKDYGRK